MVLWFFLFFSNFFFNFCWIFLFFHEFFKNYWIFQTLKIYKIFFKKSQISPQKPTSVFLFPSLTTKLASIYFFPSFITGCYGKIFLSRLFKFFLAFLTMSKWKIEMKKNFLLTSAKERVLRLIYERIWITRKSFREKKERILKINLRGEIKS